MSIQFPGSRSYSSPAIRKYAIGFAAILAFSACWLIVPEVCILKGQSAAASRIAAETALIRGDLWARAAAFAQPGEPSWQLSASRRAVGLEPIDARSWLSLARASMSAEPAKAAAELKMSFYTGPAEDQLISGYLTIIPRLDLSADDELQYLLERQIDKILHHHPDLQPALIAMYRQTSLQNQSLIEKLVATTQPQFAPELKAAR